MYPAHSVCRIRLPVGPKGLEPLRAGLKVRCAAVTPRPRNVGRAYAFQPDVLHIRAPCFNVSGTLRVPRPASGYPDGTRSVPDTVSGSPESRTQRYAVISRVRATGPRLPFANVIVVRASRLLLPSRRNDCTTPVGMAGLEPASPCSQSTWVRRYPTSRQSERADSNRRSPGPRPGAITRLRHVLINVSGTGYPLAGGVPPIKRHTECAGYINSPCGSRTRLCALKGRYPQTDRRTSHVRVRFTQWTGRCSNPRLLVFSQVLNRLSYQSNNHKQ